MTTITLPRATVEQALEALEWSWGGEPMGTLERDAITALRAALEEPQTTHSTECYQWHHRCAIAEVERLRAALAQQAEPGPGKVVAWGVFALADGEWQLQHPVFVGDECGKENAEFERASYSGPQPLEVRPLGVVTATARQAEPVQEPVAWMFELARNFNLEGYGGWEKRITEYRPNTPEGSVRNVTPLYTTPPQRKPLTEEEIEACRQQGYDHDGLHSPFSFREAARAVERAIWEKNT